MATRTRKKKAKVSNVALAKAHSHPIRVKLLGALQPGRVASPNELSKEIGLDLSVVSYHVRKLLEFDCIELVDTKPVRGAVEHFYRATSHPFYSDDLWAQLSSGERSDVTQGVLALMAKDIQGAAGAGTIDSRVDRHLSRSPVQLDDEGWATVAEELEEFRQRVEEIAAESVNRLASSGGEGISARLMLLFFEAAKKNGR